MPANNSKTNRNIRRASALARFKISPTGSLREGRSDEDKATANVNYLDAKNAERAALMKRVGHSYED